MLVGMAPGRLELTKDQPFIGPSGRLLWALAKVAGIDRADCFIVNTIGEWPEGKDGNPTPAQYDAWWDRFDAAVRSFRGQVIVPLGGAALWRTTGNTGIDEWRGYIMSPEDFKVLEREGWREIPYKRANPKKGIRAGDMRRVRHNTTINPVVGHALTYIPALHPSGVLRSGLTNAPLLQGDLHKVSRVLRAATKPSRVEWLRGAGPLGRNEVLAVDIETGDATSGFADITRIGVAGDREAWTAPWSAATRERVREIIEAHDGEIVMHNRPFDEPRLEKAGVSFAGKKMRCSMFAAALLQPDLKKGLNAVGSMYLDCPRWKHKSESDPELYNALDALRTHELWLQERTLLEETNQLKLFTDTIMPGLAVLIEMSEGGLLLDPVKQAAWIGTLRAEFDTLHRQWSGYAGTTNFNSAHQIKKFFREQGLFIPFNKDGKESADKQAMRRLLDENPQHADMIKTLLRLKAVNKEIGTYAGISPGSDGHVHPHFGPAWKDEDEAGKGIAGTWRPTANNPNLQNQPPVARAMYIPRPGNVFVGGDWSQLEARILGGYSGDDELLGACNGPVDIHTTNQQRLGLDRVRAKNGFYGWSYLASAKTLQLTFKGAGMTVPLKECEALLASFDNAYKKAAAFRVRALTGARALGYVENGFGMRRYFPHEKFPAPAAIATLIQSSGAFMLWNTLPAHAAGAHACGGRPVLTVHDDVMWEVPAARAKEARALIREVMQHKFPEIAPDFYVPAVVKQSAESWGALKEVTE